MNTHARSLFCTLTALFTSPYQRESFRALIALFLRADGRPQLSSTTHKSASALSRFLNHYRWNARTLIRHTRDQALDSLYEYYRSRRGRRPRLLVMLDLTTLGKTGRFENLGLVRILNKKRGLHVVVMYLVAGPLRLPWAFRVWRGRGEKSPAELAVQLLRSLPEEIMGRFRVLVLGDGGFSSIPFLEAVHEMGFDAVVGMRFDRCLEDGRSLAQVRSGEAVTLVGLSFPVWVGRYRLWRDGKRETRFVVATFEASGRVLSRWGRRRWAIEGFFKVAKWRFGLARFAQDTRRGAYRFLVLSLLAFVLSQFGTWGLASGACLDWGEVATEVRCSLLPDLVWHELLAEFERVRPYLEFARDTRGP